MAKLYSSEIAVRAAEDGVQIHGGYGFVKDYPGREVLPRREAHHDRRGHERDSAARHRPSAPWPPDSTLADRVLAGDARALARAISLVEDETPAGADLLRPSLRADRPRVSRRRHRPAWRRQEHARRSPDAGGTPSRSSTVGVIAVDPTSPFTGGAILGDRVRMGRTRRRQQACSSAAWRRAAISAALARATSDVALVLDAAGKDVVIIETVGVGQDEVDIVADRRHLDRGARARRRRRGAGAQGRHHGDCRHLRRQQGGSRRRRSPRSGDRRHAVAADVRARRVAAADSEDRGDDGRGDSGAVGRHRRSSASSRPTPGTGGVPGRSTGCGSCSVDSFCSISNARCRPASSTAWSIASSRGELDPYSAAARLIEAYVGRVPRSVGGERGCPPQPGRRRKRTRRSSEGHPRPRRHRRAGHRRGAGVLPRRARAGRRGARGGGVTARPRALHPGRPESRSNCSRRRHPIRRSRKYLEKRGPGLHHITLRVDDIDAALAQLQARGVRLVDEQPRAGAEGALVAFIHPSAAHGVLVELKQRAARGRRSR